MAFSGEAMSKRPFVALLVLTSATAVLAQQPAFKRTVLQTVELSIEGREAVTAKAELPVGISAGRHTHPGEEIGYLLEGTVTIEIEGVSKTLKAGDAFAIPAGKVHNATNIGTGQATIVSTYIVEKGKPLATPVK
jgi:quercetin dioxygenase-like cupin family protein